MNGYYLIGERLAHSWSAEIHRAFGRYDYELKELSPGELGPFLKARDFAGLNVTIPYKEAVIPWLDRLDEQAAAIGAVNTVVNRDGVLWGYNTDFGGLRSSLERLCAVGPASRPAAGCRPPEAADSRQQATGFSQKTLVILGTGGTSKTALAVCKALGAAEIFRVSRTGREGALRYEALFQGALRPDLILNCTPVGMWPDSDGLPIDLKIFDSCHSERSEESASPVPLCHSERSEESASPVPCPLPPVHALRPSAVFDCVYNPIRTRLVLEARARSIPASGGLYMLVKQAALACELFTGAPVEDEQVDIICSALGRKRENIVLIGMPGAGKTTVGRILAQKTGREFVDSDEEIVIRAGKSIPAIFAAQGEAAFRALEAELIREAALKTGCVIATGGGTLLREENLRRLKQSGRLVLLDRPLAALEPSPDRPLGDTADKVARLYAARDPIYRAAADLTVPAAATAEDTADAILAAL